MGIKADFTMDDVKARFDAFLSVVEKKQIELMQQLGEMCLGEARTHAGYMMQTGALTSSTGYVVYVDGVAVHSHFDAASGAQSGAAEKGINAGRTLADKVGKETKGICLVCVAGMDYALYVEARGKNVLTSANQLAQTELPRMLEQLCNDIKRVAE